MEKSNEKFLTDKPKDYTSDYQLIMRNYNDTFLISTQWSKKGDFFEKFSIYDKSYSPIASLGGTTLIKNL